ncbi:MAG: hypothetical protein ACI4VP_03895 [Clostridia bacterium]
MKKQMKIFLSLILVFGILLNVSFSLANVAETDNGKMKFYARHSGAFDIKGYVNGTLQSTTFYDGGYESYLKVNDNEMEQMDVEDNYTEHVINGVAYDISCSFVNDGRYVKVLYTLTNNNENNVTISLGTCADVQVAKNDRATIERYENSKGLKLYDNESNIQFNFYGKSVAGTTDIDNLWIGKYPEHDDNVFSNNTTNKIEEEDSAFTYSWTNRTIEPGDTKRFSVIIGIGEVSNAPKVELDASQGRCFSQDEVVIKGKISDQDANSKATLYYTIDNGEESNLEQQSLTNNELSFSLDLTSKNLSLGSHTIELWALDEQGNPSEIVEKQIFITNLKAPTLNMSEEWSKEEVKFTVTDDKNDASNVSKYQYKIGDGAWQDISLNTEKVALSTTGTVKVSVKAVGHETDEESSIVSKTAKLDALAPTISISETDGKITIIGTDEHSGVKEIKYLISKNEELAEDEVFGNYTEAVSYTGNETGDLYLHIVAIDNLGNEAKQVKKYAAPVAAQIESKDKFTDVKPTYKITAQEEQVGYKYQVKINDGEWKNVELNTEYTIENPVNGKNSITTRTIDPLGRVSNEIVSEVEYVEDTTKAPENFPDTGIGKCIVIISIVTALAGVSYICFKKYKEI